MRRAKFRPNTPVQILRLTRDAFMPSYASLPQEDGRHQSCGARRRLASSGSQGQFAARASLRDRLLLRASPVQVAVCRQERGMPDWSALRSQNTSESGLHEELRVWQNSSKDRGRPSSMLAWLARLASPPELAASCHVVSPTTAAHHGPNYHHAASLPVSSASGCEVL